MLQKLWRFLGFGADDSNDEILDDLDTRQPDDQAGALPAPDERPTAQAEVIPAPQFDADMRLALFDGVLAVFNTALPDFLARSVDPAAQRRALADALDASITGYLGQLEAQAAAHAESVLRSATDASKAESERLMKEMELLEKQKAKLNEAQLSSDRRRRALQDRTHDLEQQVGRLEAEREQYQLENRSLLNKIKLSQVQPEVIEDLQKEIERLKAEGPAPEHDPADAQRIADLTAGLEVANQMYSKAVEDLTGEHEQHLAAQAQLASVSEELERSARELDAAHQELDRCRAEVEELAAVKQSVDDLQQALAKVKEVIAGRDQKIERLKAANRKLRQDMAELRRNLPGALPEEPAALTPSEGEAAVDTDDFECPDWFVSEPDPAAPGLQRQPNLDFGYTEPPRKPRLPDNDAQLSLF